MRKHIYQTTKAFRVTDLLNVELTALADKTNRNEADLMRTAIAQFVGYYKSKPEELVKLA